MTSSASQLRKQKSTLWQKSMVTNDPVNMAQFRRSRHKLRQLTRQPRKSFEALLVAEIKGNQKAFWKYSNSRLKTKPRIANLRDTSGLLVTLLAREKRKQLPSTLTFLVCSPIKSRVRYPLPLAKL